MLSHVTRLITVYIPDNKVKGQKYEEEAPTNAMFFVYFLHDNSMEEMYGRNVCLS